MGLPWSRHLVLAFGSVDLEAYVDVSYSGQAGYVLLVLGGKDLVCGGISWLCQLSSDHQIPVGFVAHSWFMIFNKFA